jgi:D-glycero-D-manno-heptose 1,7-bisphosphate phosphatase
VIHNPQRKALFLDRDGIINIEKNYVHKIEDFEFMDGIFDLCRTAENMGFLLIVVTNQAGIGRGYYYEADFNCLSEWMNDRFMERGIKITDIYFCPYHPEFGQGEYKRESENRKPNPGMILQACNEWKIDSKISILVGDKESDILAGRNAGVGTNILVRSTPSNQVSSTCADLSFGSVKDVALWLKSCHLAAG